MNNNKLFRLVLVRHEQSYYEDVEHDLTPGGIERARKVGIELKEKGTVDVTQEVHLFHSPKPRAKETLDFIVDGGDLSGVYKEVSDIRSSDFADLNTFLKREKELGLTLEDVAREHYENDELYENSPHIVESHTSRRLRFYKFLSELVLLYILAESSVKQIVAVSHFEILTYIIHDVFDIKSFSSYMAPALGEYIIIDFSHSHEPGCVEMDVYFRDRNECVNYNFISRNIF